MYPLGHLRHLRSLCAIVQLVTFVPACSSWQVQSTTPRDVVAAHPDLLLVIRSDSSRATLRRPEISGDTLYGTAGPKGQRDGPRTDGIALTDVDHVAVRRSSGTKTAALVGVGVAAAATFAVLCFTTAGVCFPEGD
jgi:hypothetical protein